MSWSIEIEYFIKKVLSFCIGQEIDVVRFGKRNIIMR